MFTYTGHCTVGLENPDGQISGTATIRIDQHSKNKAEVSIDGLEAPPECGDSLMGFLNGSVPEKVRHGNDEERSARASSRLTLRPDFLHLAIDERLDLSA